MNLISFRELKIEDLDLLVKWLHKPHIQRWYGEKNTLLMTLEIIQKKMLPRIYGEEAVFCFLILRDENPIGYIQWYDARKFPRDGYSLGDLSKELGSFSKLAALDLYIGEEDLIGKGVGSIVIKQFLKEIILSASFDACYVDPEIENYLSINAFKKAGFIELKTITTSEEKVIQPMVTNLMVLK